MNGSYFLVLTNEWSRLFYLDVFTKKEKICISNEREGEVEKKMREGDGEKEGRGREEMEIRGKRRDVKDKEGGERDKNG